MLTVRSCTNKIALLLFSAIPSLSFAQTTHVVQVTDFAFTPRDITIQAGDTVRWENAPGGAPHNVIAENLAFASGPTASSWTYEFTFNTGGDYPYYCQPHRNDGMVGSVTVQGNVDPGFDIDPGHSGNWWNGLARDGEGAQIEVSNAGGGQLVFVVTVYSYGPAGGQIFLIGVGTPDGDTVEVDVFITEGEGGVWGDAFDPDNVDQPQWGTGTFTAESCELIHMMLTPNQSYQNEGYTNLEYDLVRLTTPAIACPYEG